MTLDEFTKEYILQDTVKLQYLYGLKKVIRYNQGRAEEDSTESVAEHVYGMHILAQYFLPLEDPQGNWDRTRIYEMITIHDIDEIETGDVLGYTKTAETRALELESMKQTINKSPEHLKARMKELAEEYEAKETPEAKFAKAIDKIEPLYQIFNEEGRLILKTNKTTAEQSMRIKAPYVVDFPFIKKCSEIIHQELIDGNYYWKEGE
jgi:putative hydrolases of HD superfamily